MSPVGFEPTISAGERPQIYAYDLVIECLFYNQISPGQELQTRMQTDGNDIRRHTAQTHDERTSTESNLVTAQSIAHEPPEDGRTY